MNGPGEIPPSYILELPKPVNLGSYYENAKRTGKGGKVYTTKMISAKGHVFRQEVVLAARKNHRVPPKFSGRLTIHQFYQPPDNARRDLDNIQKCLLDALTAAKVILDDSQIDWLDVIRCNPKPPDGCLTLVIMPFDPDAADALARSLIPWWGQQNPSLFLPEEPF